MKKDKPLKHYVDNQLFLENMVVYRNSVLAARENEMPRP